MRMTLFFIGSYFSGLVKERLRNCLRIGLGPEADPWLRNWPRARVSDTRSDAAARKIKFVLRQFDHFRKDDCYSPTNSFSCSNRIGTGKKRWMTAALVVE